MEFDQFITRFFVWSIGSLVIYVTGCVFSPAGYYFACKKLGARLRHLLLRMNIRSTNKFVCVSDPRALQEILVKEHDAVFTHAPGHLEVNNLIFGPGLFGISGIRHELQRKALNPVFTSSHIKSMSSAMDAVAYELIDTIISIMNGADTKEIDMLEWCKMAALETIGQAGFGYSFGALKDNHSPYVDTMKNAVPTFSSLFRLKGYIGPTFRLIPISLWRAVAKWVPSDCIQRIGEMIETQAKYSSDILESGKTMLSDSTGGESYDILSTLIRTTAHAKEEDKLSEDQLRGQINTIVFAGFETTSSSLARTIHFLAEHPHIQDQLREELQAAHTDLRDCDTLPYLDAIVRETLRLFPPVPTVERYASKDWVVPLQYPNQDNERQIYIEKGTRLLLSLSRANRCRDSWGDDADEFRPERWLNPLPQSVSKGGIPGVYSSMMTFAAGPRSCIGYRFAVLELKIVLARLVETFQFAPGQQPVEWRNLGFMSPHVTNKGEDGTVVLDKAPSLPLLVSILR